MPIWEFMLLPKASDKLLSAFCIPEPIPYFPSGCTIYFEKGIRGDDHKLIETKPGVTYLADVSNSVILPTAITGAENSLRKMFTHQHPRIHFLIGMPYQLLF